MKRRTVHPYTNKGFSHQRLNFEQGANKRSEFNYVFILYYLQMYVVFDEINESSFEKKKLEETRNIMGEGNIQNKKKREISITRFSNAEGGFGPRLAFVSAFNTPKRYVRVMTSEKNKAHKLSFDSEKIRGILNIFAYRFRE